MTAHEQQLFLALQEYGRLADKLIEQNKKLLEICDQWREAYYKASEQYREAVTIAKESQELAERALGTNKREGGES